MEKVIAKDDWGGRVLKRSGQLWLKLSSKKNRLIGVEHGGKFYVEAKSEDVSREEEGFKLYGEAIAALTPKPQFIVVRYKGCPVYREGEYEIRYARFRMFQEKRGRMGGLGSRISIPIQHFTYRR